MPSEGPGLFLVTVLYMWPGLIACHNISAVVSSLRLTLLVQKIPDHCKHTHMLCIAT